MALQGFVQAGPTTLELETKLLTPQRFLTDVEIITSLELGKQPITIPPFFSYTLLSILVLRDS